ncbi:MAG: GTP-binding protein [Microgenomates group bacterium]
MIPVLLVTGFLGSGKTTFLNWLLKSHPDKNISLLLNEFGDIKLESQFITHQDGIQIAELNNGCMCCVAKSDIPRVVEYILENAPHTDYLVVEASGLSVPDPIHDALRGERLSQLVRLDAVICVIDAVNFEKTRSEHSVVLSQIGDSDIVLLNKVTDVDAETIARISEYVSKIGSKKSILIWDESLDPKLFLEPNLTEARARDQEYTHSNDHDHAHEAYTEYWFLTDFPINSTIFSQVMRNLPANIVRAKGYINVNGTKAMVQYVGSKLELIEADWGDTRPSTAVLFLGKEIDTATLKSQLETTVFTEK